jgi:hypothetical protein
MYRPYPGRGETLTVPIMINRKARIEDASILFAAEREIALTPDFLVSRLREHTPKALEGKVNRRTKLLRVFALLFFS